MSNIIITVTVGLKPTDHPFYNRGSKYCYYINGIPGKELDLIPDQEYVFSINTPGHPFYFTTSESGGSEDQNILENFSPTDKGKVVFIMKNTYPNNFYYQCKIHSYMGGYAHKSNVSHNTFYVTPILRGLVAPTALCSANGDPTNVYIADQIGLVYRYNLITQDISIFLDVREYVPKLNEDYDERGLLGLCMHPEFITNGRFFIYYSSRRDNRAQYTDTSSPNSSSYYNCLSEFTFINGKILYEAEKVILRMTKNLPYHNGGKIGFGPDGYLYVTVGDAGPQGDIYGNAQNLGTWFGKILRIDINIGPEVTDSSQYYRIPIDNPFVNIKGILPEIWAYGFRNPWGLEFINNALIVSDAGYNSGSGQEEINIVVKGGNYGWNIKEGKKIAPINTRNMIDPIFAYTTSDPTFADSDVSVIIGGYVNTNKEKATEFIDYICADYSGRLIRLYLTNNGAQVIETASLGKWILSFGKTSSDLYVLTSEMTGPKGTTGEVYALTVI